MGDITSRFTDTTGVWQDLPLWSIGAGGSMMVLRQHCNCTTFSAGMLRCDPNGRGWRKAESAVAECWPL